MVNVAGLPDPGEVGVEGGSLSDPPPQEASGNARAPSAATTNKLRMKVLLKAGVFLGRSKIDTRRNVAKFRR
jgi:hypothetical protein